MRNVVFRTPGKLDLRSITVFGLNVKPETKNPIGYFGAGLKYAIAVLMRTNHHITIWVGKQKWTVVVEPTTFRKKGFSALYLVRHTRSKNQPKSIPLPFTTELGKNWQLWQAFRELYANTLDENGHVEIIDCWTPRGIEKPHTYIVVEGEDFVQEYIVATMNRLATNGPNFGDNPDIPF